VQILTEDDVKTKLILNLSFIVIKIGFFYGRLCFFCNIQIH